MKITTLCSITSDWKTFCSTGENPDHLVTTKENLNEELLQNSEKRDDLEMKVVQIVIYDHQKNIYKNLKGFEQKGAFKTGYRNLRSFNSFSDGQTNK